MAEDKRPTGEEIVGHVTKGPLTKDYTFSGIEDLPDVLMSLGADRRTPVTVDAYRMDDGGSAKRKDMCLLLLFETEWPDSGTRIRFVVEGRPYGGFRPSTWDMGTLEVTSLDTVDDGIRSFVEGSVPLDGWEPVAQSGAVTKDGEPDWSEGGTSGDAHRTEVGMSYVGRPMLP